MTTRMTICVLTYGDHSALARRCINSILQHGDRSLARLIVGVNAGSPETLGWLRAKLADGSIDVLHESATNLNKCPMMRRMFADVDTEFIWWFDDDSHIVAPEALRARLEIARAAPPTTVMWGHQFFFGHERDFSYGTDVVGFVKSAAWYRGLEPPGWEPGGKGEWNFEQRGVGDGRWFFITGGCWLIRTSAVRALDWPDPRLIKRNDDVFLCEAIRQQGWQVHDIGGLGVMINDAPRRGAGEDAATMRVQMQRTSWECAPDGWFFEDEADAYRAMVEAIYDGVVVEVGVWKGRSLHAILDSCQANRNTVYAVDAWNPPADDPHYAEARLADVYAAFLRNLERSGHASSVRVIRDDSALAAARFPDASVDLVFLDGDHSYEGVLRDIRAWRPKLKPHGCLCGHDYTFREGVRRAVHEVFGEHVRLVAGSIWREIPQTPPPHARGCVFIPTFEDTERLRENFDGRPAVVQGIDVFVYDDNCTGTHAAEVEQLCARNHFQYRRVHRPDHGTWEMDHGDLSGYNRAIWQMFCELGTGYDYVIKADTDTLFIESGWHEEFARLLAGEFAIAGTPESRPTRDVMAYWSLAREAGYTVDLGDYVSHLQGGLYGLGQPAIRALSEMGFLEGRHVFFAEDCYISYSCQLLGVTARHVRTVGSWFRNYRPDLAVIAYMKAIHPLMRTEWVRARLTRPAAQREPSIAL